MRCLMFLLLLACTCLLVLSSLRCRGDAAFAHVPIMNSVMFCTVSSLNAGVPTQPTSFSAHFYRTKFVLAVLPPDLEDDEAPAPEMGTFTYLDKKSSKQGILKMEQPHKGVRSVLTLNFTHAAGGTLAGRVYLDNEIVAEQCGVFHICSDIVCKEFSKSQTLA